MGGPAILPRPYSAVSKPVKFGLGLGPLVAPGQSEKVMAGNGSPSSTLPKAKPQAVGHNKAQHNGQRLDGVGQRQQHAPKRVGDT